MGHESRRHRSTVIPSTRIHSGAAPAGTQINRWALTEDHVHSRGGCWDGCNRDRCLFIWRVQCNVLSTSSKDGSSGFRSFLVNVVPWWSDFSCRTRLQFPLYNPMACYEDVVLLQLHKFGDMYVPCLFSVIIAGECLSEWLMCGRVGMQDRVWFCSVKWKADYVFCVFL